MTSTTSKIIKNSFWLYAKMGVAMILSLWTTRIILNGLGASDFGLYNVVGGAIAMLGFLNAAMAKATQRFMSYEEGTGNGERKLVIFNVSSVLHIICALLAGLILFLAGFVFFNGVLNIPEGRDYAAKVVYGSLIISTIFTILTVPYDAVMNAHENMKYYALIGIVESILRLLVAYSCLLAVGDNLILYGVLMAIIPIISVIIMRIYCHSNYPECKFQPGRYCNKKDMVEMSKFAGWNFLGSSASLVGNYGQSIVANMFFGVLVNASLGIIQQLQGMMAVVANNMQKALNPVIVKNEGAGNRSNMLQWSLRGCKFSCYLMLWIVVPMVFEAPFVIQLWLKEVPINAVLFFRLQMMRYILEVLVCSLSTTLMAVGQIKIFNVYQVLFILMPLPLMYILYSIGFEVYWMFIVYIVSTFLFDILVIGLCKKYCGLSLHQYTTEVFIPVVFTTIAMFIPSLICHIFTEHSIIAILMSFFVSWLGMLIALLLFGLTTEEKKYIANIINRLMIKRV